MRFIEHLRRPPRNAISNHPVLPGSLEEQVLLKMVDSLRNGFLTEGVVIEDPSISGSLENNSRFQEQHVVLRNGETVYLVTRDKTERVGERVDELSIVATSKQVLAAINEHRAPSDWDVLFTSDKPQNGLQVVNRTKKRPDSLFTEFLQAEVDFQTTDAQFETVKRNDIYDPDWDQAKTRYPRFRSRS